jgi:DNA-binding HxlR family transcriptional regulator
MAELELPIQPNVLSQGCASRRALGLISEKWTALVAFALVGGPKRHADLLRMIEGVSQKMLTKTLRGMERDGLVERRVLDARPPQHVEYRLTSLGHSLADPLVGLCRWAMDHLDEVQDARRAHGAAPL